MSGELQPSARVREPSEYNGLTILGPEEHDRLATRVLCVKCGAKAGHWCKTDSGGNASRAHAVRRKHATFRPVP